MKAMLLRTPRPVADRPLELVDLPTPQPGPGEILIAVHVCGVCHTDLHIVEGELPPHKSPVVPGHQIVGRVEAVGEGVREHRVGDRVGVPWLWRTDGTCRYCRRGAENLCEHALFTGYDVDGGYAEYAVAPAAFSYKLPDMPDLAVAPLLCAGIIGYRCLRLAGVLDGAATYCGGAVGGMPGDAVPDVGRGVAGHPGAARMPGGEPCRLGLFGFGAAAHIATQVASYLGWEVYVFTRNEEHRALARRLGAVWAGAAGEAPGGDESVRLNGSVIFAPVGDLVLDALRVTDRGGIVALGGIYSTPIPPIEYPLIYDERIVRSVANSTRQDARELLEIAAEIPVETEVQVFPLAEANEALLAVKESRIRGAAVLQVASHSA